MGSRFLCRIFKADQCKIAEIQSAAISVNNCIDTVLALIKEHVPTHSEQISAYTEMAEQVLSISTMLHGGALHFYNGISQEIRHNYNQEFIDRVFATLRTCYNLGNNLEVFFGNDKPAQSLAVEAWQAGINFHKDIIYMLQDKKGNADDIEHYASRIRKYMPEYKTPPINFGGGCYVATCVYGSYDCPQVWTLRRYRDEILAKSWYGRAFIHIYYFVSPILVQWFGQTQWFQKFWKPRLDKMIQKLNADGFENTPYQDQIW